MEHGRIARAGAAARHAAGEGGQPCRSTSSSSQLLGAGGAAVVLASLHSWGLAVLGAGRRRRRGGWRGGGGGYCMARGKAKLRLGGWGWSRELSTARGWSSHGSNQDGMKNECKNPVGRASSFPQQHHKARQGFAATCVLAWPDPTRPIKALMGPCGPCAVQWGMGHGEVVWAACHPCLSRCWGGGLCLGSFPLSAWARRRRHQPRLCESTDSFVCPRHLSPSQPDGDGFLDRPNIRRFMPLGRRQP